MIQQQRGDRHPHREMTEEADTKGKDERLGKRRERELVTLSGGMLDLRDCDVVVREIKTRLRRRSSKKLVGWWDSWSPLSLVENPALASSRRASACSSSASLCGPAVVAASKITG